MAEKLHVANHEHHEAGAEAPRHHEALKTPELSKAETAQERIEKLAEARVDAQENASTHNPVEQLQAAEKAATAPQPTHINRELKEITLRRELKTIRRHLTKPQQALSQVIHQPVVRAVSETAGKTVSRPSGLLGGGIVALLGTSIYLYMAKHIGFDYNYVVFLVLFAGGFVVGLVLELVVHMATASRRRPH